jgi:septum formation protein
MQSNKDKLILASASPRRLDLLQKMGFFPCKVIPADIDESAKKAEKPDIYCKRIAQEKAIKIKEDISGNTDYESAYILSADTIAVCANQILGKPEDAVDAERIIRKMSGRKHQVYTCVCVISPSGRLISKLVKTIVRFKNIGELELKEYIATNKWHGKAGAYGLQEDVGGFVIEINGSFSSVIGLPMYETKNMLLGLGFNK